MIPIKDTTEIVQLVFPYDDEIGSASISSVTVDNQATYGTDATPALMFQGGAQIVGSKVFQLYKGGVVGNTYKARCHAALNDGRNLVRSIVVKVRDL